jgi:hypothetical protein
LQQIVLELLHVAIGKRKSLIYCPTDDEWNEVYLLCEKQNVLRLAFAGIQKLPKEQMPPSDLLAKWRRETEVIKRRNELVSRRCKEACEYYDKQGMTSCVLMPCGLYSNSEDIDILCRPKETMDGKLSFVEYVNFRYVSSTHHLKPKIVHQHVDWKTGSFPVEVRFEFSYLNCPWHDRRFQRWAEEKILAVSPQIGEGGFPVPSNTFSAVYQMVHLYRKLFCEGIRFGHLYDYYMVLRSLNGSEREEVMQVIGRLGMKKFAGAVMHVMQRVFGLSDEYLLCKPNNRNGSFVLSITMLAGDYTRNIERTRTLSHLGRIGHHLYWLKRNRPFLTQYPAEVCFELYRRIKG